MMRTYALIEGGVVHELVTTDGDVGTMFHPSIKLVDVTALVAPPAAGWIYDGETFTAPTEPPAPTLDAIKTGLCVAIDAAADAAYVAIGGPSPGRLAEYRQANDDAIAFKASNYVGAVPATISCWTQATGWTAQQACDDILATAAAWSAALVAIRSARLLGKADVIAATTTVSARDAANAAIASVQAIPAAL